MVEFTVCSSRTMLSTSRSQVLFSDRHILPSNDVKVTLDKSFCQKQTFTSGDQHHHQHLTVLSFCSESCRSDDVMMFSHDDDVVKSDNLECVVNRLV